MMTSETNDDVAILATVGSRADARNASHESARRQRCRIGFARSRGSVQ